MVDVHKIFKYFGKFSKFTNLPSYDNLLKGLDESGDRSSKGLDGLDKIVTQLSIPREEANDKLAMIQKIASHLWGGENITPQVFRDLEIASVERYDYATREPLRVEVRLGGDLRKAFYAKPYDELDEARLFGLELEHLLSPNKFEYSFGGEGIFEEEVTGIEAEEHIKKNPECVRDPKFIEELVKIDYRSQVMLLGDMHSLNYLVSEVFSGDKKDYAVRIIDFDNLFNCIEDGMIYTGVFSEPQVTKDEAVEILGEDRYNAIINVEREQMKKRYMENQDRIESLFEIIGSSNVLNDQHFKKLSIGLSVYHKDSSFYDIAQASNVGDLLRMHVKKELFKKSA